MSKRRILVIVLFAQVVLAVYLGTTLQGFPTSNQRLIIFEEIFYAAQNDHLKEDIDGLREAIFANGRTSSPRIKKSVKEGVGVGWNIGLLLKRIRTAYSSKHDEKKLKGETKAALTLYQSIMDNIELGSPGNDDLQFLKVDFEPYKDSELNGIATLQLEYKLIQNCEKILQGYYDRVSVASWGPSLEEVLLESEKDHIGDAIEITSATAKASSAPCHVKVRFSKKFLDQTLRDIGGNSAYHVAVNLNGDGVTTIPSDPSEQTVSGYEYSVWEFDVIQGRERANLQVVIGISLMDGDKASGVHKVVIPVWKN